MGKLGKIEKVERQWSGYIRGYKQAGLQRSRWLRRWWGLGDSCFRRDQGSSSVAASANAWPLPGSDALLGLELL